MTAILTHYFLFISLQFLIVEKFKVQEKTSISKYKFIFKLGKCDFCFNFWISVLAVLLIDLVTWDAGAFNLIMPFVIMGLWLTLKKI